MKLNQDFSDLSFDLLTPDQKVSNKPTIYNLSPEELRKDLINHGKAITALQQLKIEKEQARQKVEGL